MSLDGLGISHSTNKHRVLLDAWSAKRVVRAARCQDQVVIGECKLPIAREVVESGPASASLLLEVDVLHASLDISNLPPLVADRGFDKTAARQQSRLFHTKARLMPEGLFAYLKS